MVNDERVLATGEEGEIFGNRATNILKLWNFGLKNDDLRV